MKTKKGYVIRRGDFNYSFLHDRVQEAAKSAIPEDQNTNAPADWLVSAGQNQQS